MKGLTEIKFRWLPTLLLLIVLCSSTGLFSRQTTSVSPLVAPLQATTLENLLPCNLTELSAAEQLSCLIYQRERLMKDVAADKYLNNQALFDATRELKVLRKTVSSAQDHELPVMEVTLYAQVLMDISKHIQADYWLQWQQQPQKAPVNAPSLEETRRQIGELDAQIIGKFKQMRQNCSLSSQPELEAAIGKWLSQLPGIQPEWNKQLFSEMLTASIYPIVHPYQCQ